jgi:adenylate cyclase
MADIVSSTALYERLGDARARELVAKGLRAMSDTVIEHGGRTVKSLGDGILACFEGPAAADAALDMCSRLAAQFLEVRVGLHSGHVIDDDQGDIFGDTVNTAARLASVARPSEVLLSKAIWDQASASIRAQGRPLSPIRVKGKAEPVEIYSILTECSEVGETLIQDPGELQGDAPSALILILDGLTYTLTSTGEFVVGRGKECSLHVDHHQASRRHARLFYRAPHFVLEDSSSNGTTVVQRGGGRLLLRRKEIVLLGEGYIYPGSTPDTDDNCCIEFSVR